MQRLTLLTLAVLLAPAMRQAQTSRTGADSGAHSSGMKTSSNGSASANSPLQTGAKLSEGTQIDGRLINELDTRKSKPGDHVEARTIQDVKQGDKVILPKGTHLLGHVTRVQIRGKGQKRSVLGVTFDRAEMKNGTQVPLHLAIQALATTQAAMQTSTSDLEMAPLGAGAQVGAGVPGGGLIGGTLGSATGTVGSGINKPAGIRIGSTLKTSKHARGAVGGLDIGGILTPNSHGVFGLRSVTLESSTSGKTQESILVSSSRNIHLAGGTQILFRVAGRSR